METVPGTRSPDSSPPVLSQRDNALGVKKVQKRLIGASSVFSLFLERQ